MLAVVLWQALCIVFYVLEYTIQHFSAMLLSL